MKIGIVGAGAVGGFLGTRLAALQTASFGGHEVSALARGATLAALRRQGWRLQQEGSLIQGPVRASQDPAELGPQDLLIIAVKGPALGALAPALRPMIGPNTIILPAMNGVPWWFMQNRPEAADATFGAGPLESVDPGGHIAAVLPYSQVLGCVVHVACSVPEPGLVKHHTGKRFLIGEPAGGISARAEEIASLLHDAGFEAEARPDIRLDTWYKLWGNMVMNPVSALTGASSDRILDDELVRGFCSAVMREAAAIGAKIGCALQEEPESRHAVTRKLGAFKTSMLQDAEAGRPLELDAIVAAVAELGRRTSTPTPNTNALLGLTRLYARGKGLYPA